jgi:hypothetical protein
MKSPLRQPPIASPHPDWLNDCSFQSHQDPHTIAPGILSQNTKKPTYSTTFNRSFSPVDSVVWAATQSGLSPLSDGDREPVAEQVRTSELPGTPSQEVLSELRTLRQLSAGVFSPETNRDSLPEIIVFSLIGALGFAWPIISMVATMAARR